MRPVAACVRGQRLARCTRQGSSTFRRETVIGWRPERVLSAAIIEFRHFEDLPEALGPAVRSVTIVDPFFGVVAFIGVAVGDNTVEIADFDDDPDYWSTVDPPLD